MRRTSASRSWELPVAACLYAVLLAFFFYATGLTPKHDGRGHDGIYYAAMANDEARGQPFVPVAPYCYRLLTPLLLAWLPGPVVWRFRVFNLIVWMGVLLAWHVLARRTGLSARWATFGTVVFATSAWGPAAALYTPCYVDPLMYLLVTFGLYCVLTDRGRWLLLLLPLAVLQREQCAIVWVCALAYDVQRHGWSQAVVRRHGVTLLLCLGVYIAVRLLVKPVASTTPPPWTVAFAVLAWLATDPSYLLKAVLGVCYALGLPLVGVVLLPTARQYICQNRWALYYLLCCVLGLLGGSDKARLAFLALPVLLLAFLHGLRSAAVRGRAWSWPRQNNCIFGIRAVTVRERSVRQAGKPLPHGRGSDRKRRRRRFLGNMRMRWRARSPLVAVPLVLLTIHLYLQFPPGLMLHDGRLEAPLVDSMERSTHGATCFEAGHCPAPMAAVAGHVAFGLALMSAMLLALQHDLRNHLETCGTAVSAVVSRAREVVKKSGLRQSATHQAVEERGRDAHAT